MVFRKYMKKRINLAQNLKIKSVTKKTFTKVNVFLVKLECQLPDLYKGGLLVRLAVVIAPLA